MTLVYVYQLATVTSSLNKIKSPAMSLANTLVKCSYLQRILISWFYFKMTLYYFKLFQNMIIIPWWWTRTLRMFLICRFFLLRKKELSSQLDSANTESDHRFHRLITMSTFHFHSLTHHILRANPIWMPFPYPSYLEDI